VVSSMTIHAQAQEAQNGFSLAFTGRGFAATGEQNPFWMYSNQYGRLDAETNVLGLVQVAYAKRFNENNRLEVGGGLLANDGIYDGVKADELYATYTWKWLEINAGLKHRDRKLRGISSVAAEIKPFEKFWIAEAYHQNYEVQHPENPYIQNVSIPRINRFKAKFPELLKANSH